MAKHHPGRNFMLGAVIGSTIGAVSAMMLSKKGNSFQKHAKHVYHELESNMKKFVTKHKPKAVKVMKKIQKAAKRKRSRKR